jgi:protease I
LPQGREPGWEDDGSFRGGNWPGNCIEFKKETPQTAFRKDPAMTPHLSNCGFWMFFLSALALSATMSAGGGEETNANKLKGKRVAILVADGFEESELMEPKKALEAAGARTAVVSPERDRVKGWKDKEWGDSIGVDVPLPSARVEDFDALLLPGGVMNPDKLRMNDQAVAFVKAFVEAGKPVAAICHGPWTLVEAEVVRGRRLTSWPSLRTDIRNAGGQWSNQDVVVDKGLVTSRKPADIPAFNREMIKMFAPSAK